MKNCIRLYNEIVWPRFTKFNRLYHRITPNIDADRKYHLDSSTQAIYEGILNKDKAALAVGITLIESSNREKKQRATALMYNILKNENISRNTLRIGITGPPGSGKSSLIEVLGDHITKQKHTLSVLAIDPSSEITGGSILGDKTRMPNLSINPNAYVRPSPTRGTLGGVAQNTMDAIALSEACGFNVILVETVGVGQSEHIVADIVDMLILLIPPTGGDEIQGIKRGIVEVSDLILVTKYEDPLKEAANETMMQYRMAMKVTSPKSKMIPRRVETISSRTGYNIAETWTKIDEFWKKSLETDFLYKNRQDQLKKWMWRNIKKDLIDKLLDNETVKLVKEEQELKLCQGLTTPHIAADYIIECFVKNFDKNN